MDLSTYAKKVTVSVLYWYEKLSGLTNRKSLEQAPKGANFFLRADPTHRRRAPTPPTPLPHAPCWVRPYFGESTTSRPICEVKHQQAALVLRSVMTREPAVSYSQKSFFFRIKTALATLPCDARTGARPASDRARTHAIVRGSLRRYRKRRAASPMNRFHHHNDPRHRAPPFRPHTRPRTQFTPQASHRHTTIGRHLRTLGVIPARGLRRPGPWLLAPRPIHGPLNLR
jgi:hypothetical protein